MALKLSYVSMDTEDAEINWIIILLNFILFLLQAIYINYFQDAPQEIWTKWLQII